MSLDAVKNFAAANLSAGITSGATSLILTAAAGALFPQPSTDGAFNAVIYNATDYTDPSADPAVEIVRCTARATDTLTITRAQEGTTGVAHNTGGKIYRLVLAWTSKQVGDIAAGLAGSVTDTGAANAYAIAPLPAITAYATGQTFKFKAANANTTASTLNVNGLGTKSLVTRAGTALGANDITAGAVVQVTYDGTNFQVLTCISDIKSSFNPGLVFYAADTGSANVYAVAPSGVLAYATGLMVAFKVANINSGASTINVNALGAKNLVDREGSALTGGELQAGAIYTATYDGTNFYLEHVLSFSEIHLNTGNGYGSTNTAIRRFANAVKNVGSSMTYADSATLGMSVTINKAGLYIFSMNDDLGTLLGITRNSAQLTTSVNLVTAADRTSLSWGNGVQSAATGASPMYCAVGDVIRAHGQVGGGSAAAYVMFNALRVG